VTNRAGRLLRRVDRAAGGLAADLWLYAASAVFALVTALTSTLLPHRAWGAIACWAYTVAFLLATAQFVIRRRLPAYAWSGTRARAALTWATWATAALVPLIFQAVQRAGGRADRAQEEVLVVERMGERLLHTGTPYLGPDAILALPPGDRLMAYSPYQPGMAVFGLPRALAGDFWWTDARVWFAVVTAAALICAVRLMPATSGMVRAIQVVTVLPICALTLATGGDDLPVLALCLLALALAATGRYGWAGLAVGAAASVKLFAFPVVAVLVALALATGRGRRLLPGALGLPVLVLIPPLLVNAGAFVENVIRFPLGHGLVTSPAQSPFPGYLIAQHGPGGRYLAAGLLVAVAAAIAVRLVRRPPRTAAAAALISGYGLLAAILLMPTTRFGYLLYPAAFLIWASSTQEAHSVKHPAEVTGPCTVV
jgi:glycosyl transferase family 87